MPRDFASRAEWSTDGAQSNNRHGCAVEFAGTRPLVPQVVLCPVLLLLIPHRLRQSLGERERQRDGMFGNHRPVDVAGVGHDDVAGQQFRCHEMVDRRGRRQFQKALQIQPNNVECKKNLAFLRATCAEASLRNVCRGGQACRANKPALWRYPAGCPRYVGRGLRRGGAVSGSPDHRRKGVDLATRQNNRPLVDALRAHIALYVAGKPYRQTRSDSMPRSPQP